MRYVYLYLHLCIQVYAKHIHGSERRVRQGGEDWAVPRHGQPGPLHQVGHHVGGRAPGSIKTFPLQIGHPRNSGIAKDHLQQNIQLRNRDSNCECREETLQHLDLNSSQLMVASISVVTENIGFLCSTFL